MTFLLVLLSIVLRTGDAAAHQKSVSYSFWSLEGERVRVTARVTKLDLARLGGFSDLESEAGRDEAGRYLRSALELRAGGRPCRAVGEPRLVPSDANRLAYEWELRCESPGPLGLRCLLFAGVASAHLHFARVVRDGRREEHVFTGDSREWKIGNGESRPEKPSFLRYLTFGLEHILRGYDHLAFLLALLLIPQTLSQVAKTVTGFTLGHSATLALAALGWVRPESRAVEALIGFSVVLVSAENAWVFSGRPRAFSLGATLAVGSASVPGLVGLGHIPAASLVGLALFTFCYFEGMARSSGLRDARWVVAALFGLVHGFGFGAVLAEADLAPSEFLRALFAFNLGVEAGQLGVVLLVWPCLRGLVFGEGGVARVARAVGCGLVGGLGAFWFASRAYG
ncbi:MAG: hypothetical protein KatS3mg076_1196 [Candidatus Binatia bacterium]|nr:MAG: hypothetical protein KatS3mg076_1196 [Candidatus Binatia bacterium]